MMILEASKLKTLVTAHAKMRAAESLYRLHIPYPDNLKLGSVDDANHNPMYLEREYSDVYAAVRQDLGYLSALNADQMAFYLDNHLELIKHKNGYSVSDEQTIASSIDRANYHFQLRAYLQIAKICVLALLFVVGLAVIATTLPSVLAPAGYLGAALDGPFLALGVAVTGLSGFGLFSASRNFSPSAEEMIAYEPAYNGV
jgi:hypothetical protein